MQQKIITTAAPIAGATAGRFLARYFPIGQQHGAVTALEAHSSQQSAQHVQLSKVYQGAGIFLVVAGAARAGFPENNRRARGQKKNPPRKKR